LIAARTASTGDVIGGKCSTAKNRRLLLPLYRGGPSIDFIRLGMMTIGFENMRGMVARGIGGKDF